MQPTPAARIRAHPKFAELVARRGRYATILSIIMLLIYYGFVLVVAFAPSILGTPLVAGGVTTVGIPVGVFIILAAFLLTGLYVNRANGEFDTLNQQILEDIK